MTAPHSKHAASHRESDGSRFGRPGRCRTCRASASAACALLLQRACGLRIGELLDLELDCVHEVPGQGAWLKVPLGKGQDRAAL